MASQHERQDESLGIDSNAVHDSRTTLFRQARLHNSRKSLFNSPFSNPNVDAELGMNLSKQYDSYVNFLFN